VLDYVTHILLVVGSVEELQRHEKVKIGEFRGKHEHCRWHSNCI